MDLDQKYASIAGACMRYDTGKSKLYEHIRAGDIEAVKYGAKTLIVLESADRFFASLPRVPAKRAPEKTGA